MTEGLLDPLRHNDWATGRLLEFCRGLSPEQLQATSPGNYGTILATLQHLIGAESRYLFRLAGTDAGWPATPEETEDLGRLAGMVEDLAEMWEELLSHGFDPERIVTWTSAVSGAHTEAHAGILAAQNLNHGNEHRAQIYTILTTIGVEPPDLDGWSYAIATGRFREDPPRDALRR
jgi:uncharacterized damage-inducible protein DinB